MVVRLLSYGPKYRTKDGYLRDQQEHDTDVGGIEYEVELVDIENEPARLWLPRSLGGFNSGEVIAIGWKPDGAGNYTPIAWRTECYTPSS